MCHSSTIKAAKLVLSQNTHTKTSSSTQRIVSYCGSEPVDDDPDRFFFFSTGVGVVARRLMMHVFVFFIFFPASCCFFFVAVLCKACFPSVFSSVRAWSRNVHLKTATSKKSFGPCWDPRDTVHVWGWRHWLVSVCVRVPQLTMTITSSAKSETLGIFYWMQ